MSRSLVDQTMERRRHSRQLLALGTPGALLRQSNAWWIGAPLTIALGASGVVAVGLAIAVAAVTISTPTTYVPDVSDRD